MNEIILSEKNGQVLASSREVAEKFGKQNKHVNEVIKKLMVENSTVKNMFIESTYISSRGREEIEYHMNRDGFSLLVMGFTGKKALEWKLKYITAFNQMEEKLKTGNYISEEEKLKLQLFSKDALEVVTAHNKLMELEVKKATAPLIKENNYKQTVINGFVEEVPIYEKVNIINRICRRKGDNFANRYKELYQCFKEDFHVDLIKRSENYNKKQEKRKDKLTIIRFAEKFGFIDDLYKCCVKLYESEVKKLLKELNLLQVG